MNSILQSATASCEISTLGAELVRFRRLDTGLDYLWRANPASWNSSSPVLFPIVCALREGRMSWRGKTHAMGNHGFVRKEEFELVESSDTRALFRHVWSEKTYEMYPFRYALTLAYRLEGNRLDISYRVENVDEGPILFQIGTHPGFNCPLGPGESFEDYVLEFEKDEDFLRHYLGGANTLVAGKTQRLPRGRLLPLTRELFQDGALVFRSVKSRKLSLRSRASERAVVLSWSDMPALGLWQAKDAPFVCMEPWHGLADEDTFSGDFSQKELMVSLPRGEAFTCSLGIELR